MDNNRTYAVLVSDVTVACAGCRSYVASLIHGSSRSHKTFSKKRATADSKNASSRRSFPQIMLNFHSNNLKTHRVTYFISAAKPLKNSFLCLLLIRIRKQKNRSTISPTGKQGFSREMGLFGSFRRVSKYQVTPSNAHPLFKLGKKSVSFQINVCFSNILLVRICQGT